MSTFDVTNPDTWPVVLQIEQVAAIYGMTAHALQHAIKPSSRGVFPLRPFLRRPARWRKADVERHVIGARGLRRSA